MARDPLEVVSGLRGPEADQPNSEPYTQTGVTPPAARAYGELPEGTVEYHSAVGSLWLHLADVFKLRDPNTGYEHIRPAVDLRFEYGVARTNDIEKIHRVEGCPKNCQEHKTRIPAHAGYGLGKTVWRADAARKVAQDKQEADIAAKFMANPELAAKVLGQLEQAGFALPAKQAGKK